MRQVSKIENMKMCPYNFTRPIHKSNLQDIEKLKKHQNWEVQFSLTL